MRASIDVTGVRYGRLTALYPTEKRDHAGSIIWHCQCDCGNMIDVPLSRLRRGNRRSCGCLHDENNKHVRDHLHNVCGTWIEHLRSSNRREDNKTGFRGVYKTKSESYIAYITLSGVRYHLGTYKSFQEAVQARCKADNELYGSLLALYDEYEIKAKSDPEWSNMNPFQFRVEYTNGHFRVFTVTGNTLDAETNNTDRSYDNA